MAKCDVVALLFGKPLQSPEPASIKTKAPVFLLLGLMCNLCHDRSPAMQQADGCPWAVMFLSINQTSRASREPFDSAPDHKRSHA